MGSLSEYFNRVMNGPPFSPGEEMKYEAIRLSSFKEWPHWANAAPTLLAKEGFYFTGRDDEVCCFSCKGKIKEWQKGDDPTSEHRRWFPECPYVTNQGVENIPLDAQRPLEALPNIGSISLDTPSRNFGSNLEEESTRVGSQTNDLRPLEHSDSSSDSLSSYSSSYLHRFEEKRLATFKNWPSPFMDPASLAKAGFYFLGDFDRVQCAFCRGILRNWEPGDSAIAEHKKHFPDCPFVCQREVGNVPSGQGAQAGPQQTVSLRKERSPNELLGIMTERPKHPNMATLEQRGSSFGNWPAASKQQPAALAEAGFFYAGYSDNVKCFFCDGGLRNWEAQDDPWAEHARWFPRCSFILQAKGAQFVQRIQGQYSNTAMAATNFQNQGQVEMNRGSGRYRNSNILTVNTAQAAANVVTGIEYRVDPREVKARMDTPTVKAVLSMGYSRETVKQCIDLRLRTHGDDFPNAETLLEAIFQHEEGTRSQAGILQEPAAQPPAKVEEASRQKEVAQAAATAEPKKGKKKKKRNRKGKKKANSAEQVNVSEIKDTKEEGKEEKEEEDEEEEEEGEEGGAQEEELSLPNNDEEAKSLIQENRELKEARTCKVCMDEEVNMVFLPCGHLVCCMNCAPALRKCPICRSLVRGTVRIFLS